METDPAKPSKTRRFDIQVTVLAVFLCFLAYAGSVGGEFVFDDKSQIGENSLIQNESLFSRALLSPVWAFRGEGMEGDYWRPTFTAWTALNYRLFGLNPAGWHLSNIALHALAVVLLYLLLRRLQLKQELAAVVCLLFAVHPTHVESVAWISGSPSMLFGAAALGALLLFLKTRDGGSRLYWVLALVAYAVALLAKETAIVLPALVFASVWIFGSDALRGRQKFWSAVLAASPFAIVSLAYFLIRWAVLGGFMATGQPLPLPQTLLTIPAVLTFYLGQSILPFWLSPGYPLRLVDPGNVALSNFLLPCAVLVFAGMVARRLAGRSKHVRFGVLAFVLFLIPALNFAAFGPENIVHDRYLYLPSAGVLLAVVCSLDQLRQRTRCISGRHGIALAVAIGFVFVAVTARYVQVWGTPEALWSYCIERDPSSAQCLAQYANVMLEQGRMQEAKRSIDKALEIGTTPSILIIQADLAEEEGRLADAEQVLLTVRSLLREADRELPEVYERLAIVYQDQRRFDEGIELLREGRQRIPGRYCHFTDKIAALLSRAGRNQEAIEELEAVRDMVADEINDYSRMVLHTLALLYREEGEIGRSLVALQDFVYLSAHCTAPRVVQAREEAIAQLGGF